MTHIMTRTQGGYSLFLVEEDQRSATRIHGDWVRTPHLTQEERDTRVKAVVAKTGPPLVWWCC